MHPKKVFALFYLIIIGGIILFLIKGPGTNAFNWCMSEPQTKPEIINEVCHKYKRIALDENRLFSSYRPEMEFEISKRIKDNFCFRGSVLEEYDEQTCKGRLKFNRYYAGKDYQHVYRAFCEEY